MKVIKQLLVLCIVISFNINISAQKRVQITIKYKAMETILRELQQERFPVKKVKKKFKILLRHSTIKNENVAICADKQYHDEFVKEWRRFINNLSGQKKESFMRFAERHDMNNENTFYN